LKTDKKTAKINETINIEVLFVPKPTQKEKTKTIVFVECNAEKVLLILELTGNIE
jgi:hypothetical protein